MKNLYKYISIFLGLFILNACNSNQVSSTPKFIEEIDLSDTFVYDAQSAYKDVLRSCAGTKTASGSCTLLTLPFLSQESAIPTKEQIMQRVIVSHSWMGERFAQMLDVLPDDIKILLGAVTSIVIDDDIIPSYYWGLTGAIYIDPRYLWLSPDEANTITQKEDFRSDFSSELIFIEATRYLIDGKYASKYIRLDSGESRNIGDITYSFAGLLYHELAHANDYFPPALRHTVNSKLSVLDVITDLQNSSISSDLYQSYPLLSEDLSDMGQVMYRGSTAIETHKQTTALEMGEWFEEDGAGDMYAYSHQAEDTAMLFQLAMMKYHYNIEQDIGFLITPTKTKDLNCSDYIIAWGERNTIAKSNVQTRALYVSQKILPQYNWSEIFPSTLGTEQAMKTNINWCEAIDFSQRRNKQLQVIYKDNKIPYQDFEKKAL
jgi:hypothetical protein